MLVAWREEERCGLQEASQPSEQASDRWLIDRAFACLGPEPQLCLRCFGRDLVQPLLSCDT